MQLQDLLVERVACGGNYTLFVVATARPLQPHAVVGFGANNAGQLGCGSVGLGLEQEDGSHGRGGSSKCLASMMKLPQGPLLVDKLACGREHSVLLLLPAYNQRSECGDLGGLYACGDANGGRLGDGLVRPKRRRGVESVSEANYEPLLRPVSFSCTGSLGGSKIVSLSCGMFHTAAVTSVGVLYTWGSPGARIGHGRSWKAVWEPTPVPLEHEGRAFKCVRASSGASHILALCYSAVTAGITQGDGGVRNHSHNHVMFRIGWNGHGQLGMGLEHRKGVNEASASGHGIVTGAMGKYCACGVIQSMVVTSEEEQNLHSFGYGGWGQLGLMHSFPETNVQMVPRPVPLPGGMRAVGAACGKQHSCVLLAPSNLSHSSSSSSQLFSRHATGSDWDSAKQFKATMSQRVSNPSAWSTYDSPFVGLGSSARVIITASPTLIHGDLPVAAGGGASAPNSSTQRAAAATRQTCGTAHQEAALRKSYGCIRNGSVTGKRAAEKCDTSLNKKRKEN